MTPDPTTLYLGGYDEVAHQVKYPVWQNLRLKRPLHKDLLHKDLLHEDLL